MRIHLKRRNTSKTLVLIETRITPKRTYTWTPINVLQPKRQFQELLFSFLTPCYQLPVSRIACMCVLLTLLLLRSKIERQQNFVSDITYIIFVHPSLSLLCFIVSFHLPVKAFDVVYALWQKTISSTPLRLKMKTHDVLLLTHLSPDLITD